MKRIDPRVLNALALGTLSLILNLGVNSLGESPTLSLGAVFLFLSAGAIGVPGAIISSTVALTPTAFWHGMSFECTRLFLTCLAIGFAATRFPRIPQFFVVVAGWIVAFATIETGWFSGKLPEWSSMWALAPLVEVELSLVAGALLLNPGIWATIAQRPRVPSVTLLLVHVVALVSFAAMWSGIAVFEEAPLASGSLGLFAWWGSKLLVLGVLLPALVGFRLGTILVRNFQEWFRLGSVPARESFSGLSSEYWRRNEADDFIPVASSSSGGFAAEPVAAEKTSTPAIAPDRGICSLNRDGTITFINRRFAKLGGLKNTEVIGKKVDAIGLHQDLVVRICKLIEESLDKGPRVTEMKIPQRDGSLCFYEVAAMPADQLEDSAMSAGPDCAIVTLKDITDRRTVEAHLLQAQRLGSLGNLAGGIAHGFNNALTTIVGRASFARVAGDWETTSDALDEIIAAASRAGELVRQLCTLSEESPNLTAKHDLNRIIGERVALLRNVVGENYTVQFEQAVDGITVECDSHLIAQAITNVVINARDAYNGKSGTIEVSVSTETLDEDVADLFVGARPGEFARIRIKDTGFGMSPETLARAFDPLFSTKRSRGNSGLGLSIVYSIVRAHDGFLAAESHPEKGTTITMYLPLREIAPAAQPDARPTNTLDGRNSLDAVRAAHHARILVVEDEKPVRDLVATMLTNLGYEVDSCENGAEAVERCRDEEFDLVLLDMVMPQLNGADVIASLRQSGKRTNWLMMTGYGFSAEGIDADTPVIPKPFDILALGKAVKDVLAPNRG